jgi:predicted nucleic acid-binding protein
VRALRQALADGDDIAVTGIVLLELLRGFVTPGAQRTIEEAFAVLEFVEPSRQDYIDAAAISTTCRRNGVQFGTVDALTAQICVSNDLTLLTTDRDFYYAARYTPLRLWSPWYPALQNRRCSRGLNPPISSSDRAT